MYVGFLLGEKTTKGRIVKKEALDNYEAANQASELLKLLNGPYSLSTPEEAVRLAAEFAAIFDDSGISSTIAAFTYSKCSALSGQ